MTSLSPHGAYPTCVDDDFFQPKEIQTDAMCLRSAPLAAACVTGTYPQKRTVASRSIWLKVVRHFGISRQEAIFFLS